MKSIIRDTHPSKSDRRRGFLLRTSLCMALRALLVFAPLRAFACTVVAPIGSPGQSGTGVTVNWGFTCNTAPSTFELIQNTAQGTVVWGKITNNKPGNIAGSITNNQMPMQPMTEYPSMQVCAGNGKTLMYCTAADFQVTTGPSGAQPGSNPTLTGLTVAPGSTPGTYVFSWTASSAYTAYLASYDQDLDQKQTYSPSMTFTLDPGTPYTFNVEGGHDVGVTGNSSWSGVWASISYTTPKPAPPPTLPPVGLQATYQSPTSARAVHVDVGWTDPSQASVTESAVRTPAWPQDYKPSISVTNGYHYFSDTDITSNQSYEYDICLTGAGGAACAITNVAVPAIPPSCIQALSCPPASNVPGTIHYSCNAPVDFYESPTGAMSSTANPEPGDSPTSYTGIDQVINPTYLIFCQKGSRTVCDALLQFMSVTSCASLPPVKSVPLKNCEDCASTDRKCERVAGGYQCVGVAQ